MKSNNNTDIKTLSKNTKVSIDIFGVKRLSDKQAYLKYARKVIIVIKNRLPDTFIKINIVIVTDSYIHKLNKKFLNKDRPTDILSFPLGGEIWGEIYISQDRARVQAKENRLTLRNEICNLIAHGVMHLAGFSHAQMIKITKSL